MREHVDVVQHGALLCRSLEVTAPRCVAGDISSVHKLELFRFLASVLVLVARLCREFDLYIPRICHWPRPRYLVSPIRHIFNSTV